MPDRLLTRSEDSMLQMEMSAVTEGSVMGVSAEVEVETTGHPLMTSTPAKISACRAISQPRIRKIICHAEKEPGPPSGSNTTNWVMDLVSLVHSVIRNLPCLMICILIRTVFI